MIPILGLVLGVSLLVVVIERLRGRSDGSVGRAGLIALAALFVFTGVSHFVFTESMEQMVPPPFPPVATVWATGVLEILGGIGLLIPRTSKLAAWCLFAFLVAVFPANIYAAVNHTGLGGHVDGPAYLWQRAPLQVMLLVWTWQFGIRRRDRR
jgi:uncharacterized membrane protein